MKRTLMAAACAAALGCGSGGYGSSSPAPAPQCSAANATVVTGAVELVGLAFVPACARVAPGTAVTFTNDDTVAHTVTEDSTPPAFDSGTLAPSASFVHPFASAGTVRIHCNLHPEMRMTVFVQ